MNFIYKIKCSLKPRKVSFRQELVDNNVELSVRHLKQFFKFGHGRSAFKTKAVHDVSFDVKKGECFGLVGESGCGKTTTGRSLIRLYNITSGSIYFEGQRVSAGTRWNEKEIKWTKIRSRKKIKALRKEARSNFDSLAISETLNTEIKDINYDLYITEKNMTDLKNLRKERLAQAANIDDEDARELKIKEIENEFNTAIVPLKKNYKEKKARVHLLNRKKLGEYRTFLTHIDKDTKLKIKFIRDDYKTKKSDIVKHVNDVEREQIENIAQIKYDNKHVDRKLMAKMQMIFQDPVDSLDPRMTVEDIIQEGLHIQGQYNKYKNSQKVKEVLIKVGLLPEYASRYPHEFSGGQRQRIGIARALVMNPNFLICDEPISALDVSIRAQIINLLNDLKEEMGLTILFIAHDLSVVKYFCDRIAVMYYGEIVELASSDELFKHPLHPYTHALLSAIPKPDPISEKKRKRFIYNPNVEHDYSKETPKLVEIVPGHWVLANSAELEKYQKQLNEIK